MKWALAAIVLFLGTREIANQVSSGVALFIMGCSGFAAYLVTNRRK